MERGVTQVEHQTNVQQTSYEQYAALYDILEYGLIYLDSEGGILDANHTADAIMDYPVSKMHGINFISSDWSILSEDGLDLSHVMHPVLRVFQTGQTLNKMETCFFNKQSKKYIWVSLSVIPYFAPNTHKVISVCLSFYDISIQKKIESRLLAAEKRYRTLFFGTRDSILITDLEGFIEEMNHSAEKLLKIDKQKNCCLHLTAIHPAEEAHKIYKHIKKIKKGNTKPFESKIVDTENRLIEVEIHSSLIEVNGRVVVQRIYFDITSRKQQEHQRLANEQRQREALIREVHHRIKNNLQGITGVLCQFADTHSEVAEPICQAITQVRSIAVIHGLQGRTSTTEVRLCELIEAISQEISLLWQTPIEVVIPCGWIPFIIAEKEAVPMALVINELIANAVKHGNNSGTIEVRLTFEEQAGFVQFAIYNTGHIPARDRKDCNGLELVSLLMPPKGTSLSWQQQGCTVITLLKLSSPIISLEKRDANNP